MSASLAGTYFDGETLRAHAVTLESVADGQIRIVGEGVDLQIPPTALRISDRLGSVPVFVQLPDRGMLEIPCDAPAVATLAELRPAGFLPSFIHRLESHAAIAAAATLLLALTVAGTLWQGLPRLAHRAAFAVPATIEADAGMASYAYFSRSFPPSTLSYYQRNRAYHALERLKKARPLHVQPKIYFFHLGMANAFALPGGIIVVGDELVLLARSEEEIASVFAHEIGHVEMRHGLQSVLRNSSALIVVSTVTGDLSTLSTFSGTLPFLLLQYGYNREFEREADAFAVGLLKDAKIDPVHFALILQRLENSRPTTGADFSYLSTHPPTEERLAFLRSFGSKLAVAGRPAPSARNASILEMSKVDVIPHAFRQDSPAYPMELRKAGVTGEVTVDFYVDNDGSVKDAEVFDSSNEGFDEAALAAVRQWKFEPGKKDGHPVPTHMQVPIGFTLTDNDATASSSVSNATLLDAAGSPADEMPFPIDRQPAFYPQSMRDARIAGDVKVEFDVDTSAKVSNARIVSSPHPDFDEPALQTVRQWRFQPAVKNSRAVKVHLQDTLKFRLN